MTRRIQNRAQRNNTDVNTETPAEKSEKASGVNTRLLLALPVVSTTTRNANMVAIAAATTIQGPRSLRMKDHPHRIESGCYLNSRGDRIEAIVPIHDRIACMTDGVAENISLRTNSSNGRWRPSRILMQEV